MAPSGNMSVPPWFSHYCTCHGFFVPVDWLWRLLKPWLPHHNVAGDPGLTCVSALDDFRPHPHWLGILARLCESTLSFFNMVANVLSSSTARLAKGRVQASRRVLELTFNMDE